MHSHALVLFRHLARSKAVVVDDDDTIEACRRTDSRRYLVEWPARRSLIVVCMPDFEKGLRRRGFVLIVALVMSFGGDVLDCLDGLVIKPAFDFDVGPWRGVFVFEILVSANHGRGGPEQNIRGEVVQSEESPVF